MVQKRMSEFLRLFTAPSDVLNRPWKRCLYVLCFPIYACLVMLILGGIMVMWPIVRLWTWIVKGSDV